MSSPLHLFRLQPRPGLPAGLVAQPAMFAFSSFVPFLVNRAEQLTACLELNNRMR